MRKLALMIAIAAVAAGVAATRGAADPPEHFVFLDDVSFQSGSLTRRCGTPVFITVYGRLRITLRTGPDGAVHETDVYENWTVTYSAPATGRSFSVKLGPGFFDYPDGVFLGAPAVVSFVGVQQNVPGLPASAGRIVFPAEVVFVSPDGVPFVDPTGPTLSENGNLIDPTVTRAAICAALTG